LKFSDVLLRKFALQRLVCSPSPSTLELLTWQMQTDNLKKIKIQVIRNHSFELVERGLYPYLEYSGLDANFQYTNYDDAMHLSEIDPKSDLYLVWFDYSNLDSDAKRAYIASRLQVLREQTTAPILSVSLGPEPDFHAPGFHHFNVAALVESEAQLLNNAEKTRLTGTRISSATIRFLTQKLGMTLIPASLGPLTKSLIFDLDNTLFSGVLGEDGIKGIKASRNHVNLYRTIKHLASNGILVSLVTKNDPGDVKEWLDNQSGPRFDENQLFRIEAGWHNKSESVNRIINASKVLPEGHLFVDDNFHEHLEVGSTIPGLKHFLADSDGENLDLFFSLSPLLLEGRTQTREDSLRILDLKAEEVRASMGSSQNMEEFLKDLQVSLYFSVNDQTQAPRIYELSNKTNQFIFTYARFSEMEVENYFVDEKLAVVSVSLKDRISDSGVVAALFFSKVDDLVILDEAVISCRALGRRLEGEIILGACKVMMDIWSGKKLSTRLENGPRNEPAKAFYSHWLHGRDWTALNQRSLSNNIEKTISKADH